MADETRTQRQRPVTVLAGGVGAARFLRGLCSHLDPASVTVVVNTADDENFFGLHVSPDLDTVTYTLAGRVNRRMGWGVERDSFTCLRSLRTYYDETWFRLGDRDLATHLYRSDALGRGASLLDVTATIASRLGIRSTLLPMSNDRVRTVVQVAGHPPLPFQSYLVRHRAQGRVEQIRFSGIRRARPAPGVVRALLEARFVIVPPSNPLVSIAPILALRGVRRALRTSPAKAAAISPLIGARPVKGPLHRMLAGLGHEVSAVGVARLYQGLVDLFVIDRADAELAPRIAELGLRPVVVNTLMTTPARARALARRVLRELSKEENT